MTHPFENIPLIWNAKQGQINETLTFMTEVSIENPADCHLFLHINSQYALYVNGILTALDTYPDYENYRIYDELDLSSFLQSGLNTLEIAAYSQGESSFIYRGYPAELSFALYQKEVLLTCSSSKTLVRQDKRFKTDVPKISPQLSYSFDYSETAEQDPWQKACELGLSPVMFPRPIKKLELAEPAPATICAYGQFTDTDPSALPAIRMQQASIISQSPNEPLSLPFEKGILLEGNWFIVDLQKETVGYLLLDLTLPCETDILIGWGEHLDDLRVRTYVGGRHFAARFHGKAGRNQFLYPFKRLGLRYLELCIVTSSATVHYAGVRPSYYPISKAVHFQCADHLHTKIYEICLRTLLNCMHEHYEDCPWREQALYTMDSRNQMLCGYYAFEEYDFAKANLRLIALSLRDDGMLELISPGRADITIPSFSAIYLLQLSEYLQYSGDIAFVQEMLPIAAKVAETFLSRRDNTGLIPRFEGSAYWNFYEWQTGLEGYDKTVYENPVYDAPLSAFVSLGLQGMAYIMQKLNQDDLALYYQDAAASLNMAIHQHFFQPDLGCYATTLSNGHLTHYAELTQALVLACDAVPSDHQATVRAALAGKGKINLFPVTLSHSIFKYEALLQDANLYAKTVFEDVASEFGNMLYQGATTFWETADGSAAFSKAGSLCHGWSAIPSYLYLRYCLDIRDEGGKLTSSLTGIYEPHVEPYINPAPEILL